MKLLWIAALLLSPAYAFAQAPTSSAAIPVHRLADKIAAEANADIARQQTAAKPAAEGPK